MSGLLSPQPQGLLQPENRQGLLGVSGQAQTYAQKFADALKRLPAQLLSSEYARVFEPQGAAADMSRRAFWQGSVMGVPEDVKKREMDRSINIGVAAMTAPAKKPDYQIAHKPMTEAGGAARLHDLTPAFGDDVYSKNALQYFGSGDPREAGVLRILNQLRGKPDATVTIYRGVPDGVGKINPGDWVTLDPKVAADYGKVVKMEVPASHITSWADSLLEFGYYPPK